MQLKSQLRNNFINLKSDYKNSPQENQINNNTMGTKEFKINKKQLKNLSFDQSFFDIRKKTPKNEVKIVNEFPNEMIGKQFVLNPPGNTNINSFHNNEMNLNCPNIEENHQSLTCYEPIVRYVKIPKYKPKFFINQTNTFNNTSNFITGNNNSYSKKLDQEILTSNKNGINLNSTYTGKKFLNGHFVDNNFWTLGQYLEEEEQRLKTLPKKILNFNGTNNSIPPQKNEKMELHQSEIIWKLNQKINREKIIGSKKLETPIYQKVKNRECNKTKNKIQFLKNIPKKNFADQIKQLCRSIVEKEYQNQ